ncbi:hypothetical protein F4810DRAFT_255423 [Camillea tinctor]|nr:hypothetical protein F4810DRAFT_255423 [Camillea tinctor]
MEERAPGYEASRNEPPCYNCGMKGHLFTACPEPTRPVPAGLEASKQRQKSSNSPSNYGHGSGKKSKGPVITRYPVPPNPAQPMAHVDPSTGQPYSSNSSPGYQPYPPPYTHGYGAPQPASSNIPYDHNGRYGPPAPPPGTYTHPPPPPPLRRSPYDYQYSPPGLGGPPPSSSHVPPQTTYIPHNTHQGPPPIPLPPPGLSDQYPHRPSGPPDNYYHGPPQPYPQPPPPPQYPHQGTPYGYQGPPPPGYYPPGYGPPPPIPSASHQYQPPLPGPNPAPSYREERDRRGRYGRRGHGDHRTYDDRRPLEHWEEQDQWQQAPHDRAHPRDDHYRDNRYRHEDHGNHRSREWEHDKSRNGRPRDRQDRYQQHHSPGRLDRDHRRRRQRSVLTPAHSTPRSAPSATVDTPQESEPGEIKSDVNAESDQDDAASEYDVNGEKNPYKGFDWDQNTVFNQPPEHRSQGDLIGTPLPTEYTENVILPPTFGAKGVKSKYITPENLDDFAQSIRETRDWQVMQHHPAFLDPKDIRVEKLEDFSKALNAGNAKNSRRDRHNNHHESRRHHTKHRDWQGRNQHRDFPDRGFQHGDLLQRHDSRKRRWEESQHDSNPYRVEKRRPSLEYGEQRNKKLRPTTPEPGEVVEYGADEAVRSKPGTPAAPVEESAWALEVGEIPENEETNEQGREIYGHSYEETLKIHEEIMAEDEKRFRDSHRSLLHIDTRDKGPPSPPPLHSGPHPVYSRPSSRHSSRSHRGSQPNSRRSSFAGHISDSSGSPLTPTELELLGLGRPSSSGSNSGRESPRRQPDGNASKPRRRATRVNDAYSRRW